MARKTITPAFFNIKNVTFTLGDIPLNVLNIFSYSFLAWNVFIKKSANNLAGLLFL